MEGGLEPEFKTILLLDFGWTQIPTITRIRIKAATGSGSKISEAEYLFPPSTTPRFSSPVVSSAFSSSALSPNFPIKQTKPFSLTNPYSDFKIGPFLVRRLLADCPPTIASCLQVVETMGSNGASEVILPGNGKSESPETTVEIKIKTLDSRTYTLRVNKCVPVPALKEQIASVTGVLSEQQRLICQGKVLKDDQLLSAYHVEDGHTLHLVVSQPVTSSLSSLGFPQSQNDHNIPDNSPVSMGGRSFTFRTINLADQGDTAPPDLSRLLSTLISSFGVESVSLGSEREQGFESRTRTSEDGTPLDHQAQIDQILARAGIQSSQDGNFQFANASPIESQTPVVIPDALTTLNQYICRMRHDFNANGRALGSNFQAGNTNINNSDAHGNNSTTPRQGLPTPAFLAEVVVFARQLLMENAGQCLSELATQLQEQERMMDPQARANMQTNAMMSGVLFQNLGSLLLELGRTIMTLRMGQTSAEAVVNAGPAIFISASSPNPIMVQAGPNANSVSMGSNQQGGLPGSGLGSGLLSRNIDIRIRRVPVAATSLATDQSDRQQQPPLDPLRHSSVNAPSTQESSVRVVPMRTVVAVPAAGVNNTPSDSSRGSFGLYYSLIARVPQQNRLDTPHTENHQETRNANSALEPSLSPFVPPPLPHLPGSGGWNGSDEVVDASGTLIRENFNHMSSSSNLEQIPSPPSWLRQEELACESAPLPTIQTAITTDAEEQDDSDEENMDGIFFSSLVRQLLPLISSGTSADPTSNPNSSAAADNGTLINSAEESSRDRRDPPHDLPSKRHKM